MGMNTHNLAKVMMAVGALDDLAEIVHGAKMVNPQTLCDRILACSQIITKAIVAEHEKIIEEALQTDIFLKSINQK